ncbi:MAG: hypothetical protein JRF33_21790 [Deltaproteobacteria bacterium]|nr:hypothetical protein [Deltaproteobacteria bacterium]
MKPICLLGCCFFLVIASCGRYGFEGPDNLDACLDAGSPDAGSPDGDSLDGDTGPADSGSPDAGTGTPWASLGPEHWPALQAQLQDAAAMGSTEEATVREIPCSLSNSAFQGIILAPNGLIYGIPRDSPQLGELNTMASSDPTARLVGPDIGGEDNWYGVALAGDRMFYCPPSDTKYPLRFDPDDVDNAAEITAVDLGLSQDDENKWMGLRLAPNGLLIACPRSDEYVLAIDPEDLSAGGIRRVGPNLGSRPAKWYTGVLAPNGKIYCVPGADPQILEIDPENLTDTGIQRLGPDFGTGLGKWYGAALAPNGNIYATPGNNHFVLEIVPEDIDSSGPVGPDLLTGSSKWTGGTLAPNGRIYASPGNQGQVLEIDPENLTAEGIRRVGIDLGATEGRKYFGGVLAPNGKIYALPFVDKQSILEIDPHARANFDMNVLLNGHLNGQ